MFGDLDKSLENLLQLEFGASLPFDLSFAIPDKTFAPVSGNRNTLDCYLYDIRENRDLRTLEPELVRNADGTIEKRYPPARIKVSYCITAWSPAEQTPGIPPAQDEHTLLGNILQALLKYPELPPQALSGALAGQLPLPPTTTVLPIVPDKNSGDFWSAIGGQLRPSLDYSVTVALDFQPSSIDPMMTAVRVNVSSTSAGRTSDSFFVVGGTVRDSLVPANLVPGAWLRINENGQTLTTDANGQFIIDGISAGTYTLTVRAVGFREGTRAITVPQSDGSYDVTLSPL
jgi:Pvc16 N-terminal domain/Carboxypeptidase regulatory-like domain